jgi:soluble lytic murein transglycosylase
MLRRCGTQSASPVAADQKMRRTRSSTAYYGQLARAKLGLSELALAPPPVSEEDKRAALGNSNIVRAVEILYATDQGDLGVPIAADLAERSSDLATLAALSELMAQRGDARCTLLIGRGVLGRGYAFDHDAFPAFGLPRYTAMGPDVEPAVVYSIARQESGFSAKAVSSAQALGLMQVTPETGRYIAKKFNVAYDQSRLLNDRVYNVQIGAAEIAEDIGRHDGSYVLAFAGYNAGRGRVKEWIERYGDPRDPKVDPVDWVERIPFPETRNYVQRILESIQVYRVLLRGDKRLLIEEDLTRGTLPRFKPTTGREQSR